MKKEEVWYEDSFIKVVWNGEKLEYITKPEEEKEK